MSPRKSSLAALFLMHKKLMRAAPIRPTIMQAFSLQVLNRDKSNEGTIDFG